MLAALEQAWRGRGICAPNPSVGAVAVHKGEIIAVAAHQGAGTAHAEQLLLEQIPKGLGATIYVTLEPCNHWGKTPPCVAAIIKHGISKVIYGFSDPNPLVIANKTPQCLVQAGIDVLHFPLPEINDFYQSYQYWTVKKRPWLTAKLAQSLDGKIAGQEGIRMQISNEACTLFTHEQRLHTDIILTTAKTLHQDNPLLTARLNGSVYKKPLAILDSGLTLTAHIAAIKEASCCHIFHDEDHKISQPLTNCYYHPTPRQADGLHLSFIISKLGELGYHDVWVEGGGQLFSALHCANLVQRSYLYLAPKILGETAVSAFQGVDLFRQKKTISWEIKADNIIARFDWQESQCLPD